MKTPEEFLTRGKGNFINCTDYDDAIQAMKDYAAQEVAKFISSKPMLADSLPLSDEEIEKEAERRYGEVTGGSYHAARPMDKARFIKGAKWARDFKR